MKETDKTKAQRLLKTRAEGTTIPWGHFYKSKRLWIATLVIGTFTVGAVLTPEDLGMNRGIFCLLGLFIGRILRDVVWLKNIADGFPFTEKIVNWDKVKELAKEE